MRLLTRRKTELQEPIPNPADAWLDWDWPSAVYNIEQTSDGISYELKKAWRTRLSKGGSVEITYTMRQI